MRAPGLTHDARMALLLRDYTTGEGGALIDLNQYALRRSRTQISTSIIVLLDLLCGDRARTWFFLGNGVGSLPLHNAGYDFADAILLDGARAFDPIVRQRLLPAA